MQGGGIMLLFMTAVLIHNVNIPLTLCRGTTKLQQAQIPCLCTADT